MTLQLKDFKIRSRPISSGRALPAELPDLFKTMLENGEALLAQDFKGVTSDGSLVPGLFPIENTGISTDRIRGAADSFIGSLTPEQKNGTVFPVDSEVWRQWSNIHPYLMRHGSFLDEMSEGQRDVT